MKNISIEQIRPELTWRLRQRILYPESKLYEMEMEEDNHGYHFAAFKDNHIIAVVSLFNKGNDWQFRKFAVDETMQNMGIGRAVLQHITDFVLVSGGPACGVTQGYRPFHFTSKLVLFTQVISFQKMVSIMRFSKKNLLLL
ncbi:GNAT family N-acetyltransferase [Mucilaginibacter sp. P19]|uniref:GNAT family N-acetyltransferase n=1 Tax=Mucilaginibacter sp. P19 TaxID=3423947 RepID=UPI003D67F1B8